MPPHAPCTPGSYSALCLANVATTAKLQTTVVQVGAVQPLIEVVGDPGAPTDSRRYACLAIANLSATIVNHTALLEDGCLSALYSLANARDAMSQYYVGCSLANLACSAANHALIIEEGGLQPIITLAYSLDADIHQQAAAALRGLSWYATLRRASPRCARCPILRRPSCHPPWLAPQTLSLCRALGSRALIVSLSGRARWPRRWCRRGRSSRCCACSRRRTTPSSRRSARPSTTSARARRTSKPHSPSGAPPPTVAGGELLWKVVYTPHRVTIAVRAVCLTTCLNTCLITCLARGLPPFLAKGTRS